MLQWDRKQGTAVVVVDMVTDCILPDGVHRDEGTRQIIDNTVRLLDLARANRFPVVFVRTWDMQFIDELNPRPGDIVLTKRHYDAFSETELDQILRGVGVRNLIFAGVHTSACVLATVAHARALGYRSCVVSDCTGDHAAQRPEKVLKIMDAFFARITSLQETVALFGLKG